MNIHQRRMIWFLWAAIFLVGCDSGSSPEAEDEPAFKLDGSWYGYSGQIGGHMVGICCTLSLDIIERDGKVTGSGNVFEPSDRIGSWYENPVTVDGTFVDERLSLTLTGGGIFTRKGSYVGTLTSSKSIDGYLSWPGQSRQHIIIR